jgi:acetyl esterase/lipase
MPELPPAESLTPQSFVLRHSKKRGFWRRALGWTILSLLAASASGYLYLARWPGDGETPPRGFSSRNNLIAALSIRGVGLIDKDPPLPENVELSEGVEKEFPGKQSYEEAPELWKRLSPATYLDAGDPPTLIIHGSIDEIVPISQAEMLSKRLRELKIPFRYLRLEGWPHTMDAAVPVNIYCRHQILQFFREQVGP